VKEAKNINVAAAGSELVGLIPLEAMLMAAEYYIQKENLFILDEKQKIRLVIERLGLSSISQFVPEKRIIEYILESDSNEPLAGMTVRNFVELVGARTSAPGGGSVSALVASLGAGLGAMMGWMSYGSKKFEHLDSKMRQFIPPLHFAMKELISMIDADTNAFNDYMVAMRLPKNTDAEKKIRNDKMQEGLKKAINVPMKVMKTSDSCWEWMIQMAKYGNISSKSDLEVGAKSLETGIWGAYKNVLINIPQIQDESYKKDILTEAEAILESAKKNLNKVISVLAKR
jgi:glutamate formiminotransferase/formiminotetrahydrofolate cyclodeaminase